MTLPNGTEAHVSDSAAQREAEREALRELSRIRGMAFTARKLSLGDGSFVNVDGHLRAGLSALSPPAAERLLTHHQAKTTECVHRTSMAGKEKRRDSTRRRAIGGKRLTFTP